MQAAVVSVLLMAGVCGAPVDGCGCANSPGFAQQSFDNATDGCTVYDANSCGDTIRNGRGRDGTLWSPVTPNGTVTYYRDAFGRPLYSPLWLIHGNATFYPANYAKPYDYRQAFGYPWNGPRPLASPPIMPQAMAPSPEALPPSAWPEATAAAYLHQSQSRIASKPVLESP